MDRSKSSDHDLNKIIDERIASLIRELEDSSWPTNDIVLAIDAVIKNRWMGQLKALQDARSATPKNFVSDGNEG